MYAFCFNVPGEIKVRGELSEINYLIVGSNAEEKITAFKEVAKHFPAQVVYVDESTSEDIICERLTSERGCAVVMDESLLLRCSDAVLTAIRSTTGLVCILTEFEHAIPGIAEYRVASVKKDDAGILNIFA